MNKLGLVEALKAQSGLTKNEAVAVVDVFFNEMLKAMARGDRVEIRGLCSFYVKKYKAYTGRNPKTGEPVKIQAKRLPFFKCGKELKERVDH
ncbi:MAG: integration host factor subunit beta [Deltaproteobacteria bacterium]|jgi:integration host factor subunit beta|nr:integration host factor subunit beta [Deltaproteobacteria bacterium]MDX2497239.1 HU family DNA-binding protein [Desulfobacterales bacterium]MBW1747022.1 integration host factor subunit beta [Deltaproteobacteria bacterium]MBW1826668.1 integration host factor subunit beta [Deltaproteobacteria bacterium]MBW1968458.1 integration host factor subunit beta [Deltaproteobacteria bacterium]